MWPVIIAITLLLALTHFLASKIRFLGSLPRNRWLSFSGGVSVAYVFVHLLPELQQAQKTLEEFASGTLGFLERHMYLVALLGLAVFYGLEKLARASKESEESGRIASARVFWVHIGSFAVYNALIGYLLWQRDETDFASLGWYGLAMATHFLVNDYGLNEHHKHRYVKEGRWVLAGAIVAGSATGWLLPAQELVAAVLTAFIAGGVTMNVLKEELPEARESRFWPFAVGAAVYAVLLLAV